MSFWQRHKYKLFKYGHFYATLYGLVVINYTPQKPTNTKAHRLAVLYSHVLAAMLIVVLPVYFVSHLSTLIVSNDGRWQLQLVVNFVNTLIKHVTVTVTYTANLVYYKDIRAITMRRQQLEDAFAASYYGTQRPRRQFESMMFFKFFLINIIMAVQIGNICYQHTTGAPRLLVYIAIYTFVLWNYTENMADYFYFINGSALLFYQQLHVQLQQLLHETKMLQRRRRKCGFSMQLYCTLCDRLDGLAFYYMQIYKMTKDALHIQQFQVLGLVFTTLISNLTNFFTLFNSFVKHAPGGASPAIFISSIYALVYYVDTYIVTLLSENIGEELRGINLTMRQFNQFSTLDVRLEQTLEAFALQLLNFKSEFRICGLFNMDRRLTYLIAVTGFSYFVTLIQFDLDLKKQQ